MHAARFLRIAAFASLTLPAAGAPGDLDPGFGNDGGFTRDLSGGEDVANAVAVQSDGRILLAGHASPVNFSLVRLQADGTLDEGFGTAGMFQIRFGSFESAIGVTVQSSGRIVLGGAGLIGGVSRDFAVVGCLEDGTLDPTFGNAGVTTTDISGAYNEQVYAMVKHTDDTILLGGYHRDDLAMVRYLPNGRLDPSFGDGGKVFTPGTFVIDKQINALAIMSDGRIVAAGQASGNNNTDVVVARFLSNGTPDGNFGTDGRTYTAVGAGNTADVANCVAVMEDGRIIVGGTSGTQFLLMRYTSGGALDPTFGTGGVTTTGFNAATQKGTGMAVQSDGRILLTGSVQANGRGYFAVVRFTAEGVLDPTFSGGGVATAVSSGSDKAYAALLQPDGKLLVAGSGGLPGNQSIAAVRYETTGPPTLAQWRQNFFGTPDNTGNAADDFDADNDGLVNLLEYAFGQNPTLGSSRAVPEGQVTGGNFVSTYTAPATVTGITYAAEWSTTLTAGTWQPVNDTGTGRVHTFSVPTSGRTQLYLRWKITAP